MEYYDSSWKILSSFILAFSKENWLFIQRFCYGLNALNY